MGKNLSKFLEIREEDIEGICKTCSTLERENYCIKMPITMPKDFSCEDYEHEGTCETCTVKNCEDKGLGVLGCDDWNGEEVN